ncbi:uncharacterized protein LOC118457076 [Anopheles albimanus]|uniref:Uncharacterized protein n=1 Tax=Anopheles albimanus TaxID=7167 RepID=A0A182F2C4_ANOAL|nr:uncharacterized protein LOC118457076 [Anopheles albimanus]
MSQGTTGRSVGLSECILEFNNHIQSYFVSSTYGNETLVNRCLEKLLSEGDDGCSFDMMAYECNVFFVNLHKLFSHSMKKSNLLWSVIGVLEVAVADEETRLALVNNFRFLPLVSRLLLDVNTPEQQKRVLSLLHILSYGATADGHEIYIEKLVQKLLGLISQNAEKAKGGEVEQLALSVLVNLCQQDMSNTFVLMRNTPISEFCHRIQHFGLLACKMYTVLEQNDHIKEMDLHYLLRMSFGEVRLILASKNSFSLRHVVDFLRYVKTLRDTQHSEPAKVALTDENFSKDVVTFLQDIETYWSDQEKQAEAEAESPVGPPKRCKMKAAKLRKDRTTDGLFDILECVVSLKPDDAELYRRICAIGPIRLINKAQEDCSKAIVLLRTILENHPTDTGFAKECESVLGTLMDTIANNDEEPLVAAFARLLTTIGRLLNTTGETLDAVAERFRLHVFGNILGQSREVTAFDYSAGDRMAQKYLWSLHTFYEFSNLSPTLWYAKVVNLLKQKPIQFLIARELTGGSDMELVEAILQITTATDFPKRSVALMVQMLKNSGPTVDVLKQENVSLTTRNRFPQIPPANGYTLLRATSRNLEDRMNETVERIQDAKAAGLISVEKAELVEFYTYKINMQANIMNDLRNSLEATTGQITTLMHQNQLLMAEIEKSRKKNVPLLLKESALENENRLLGQELAEMKCAAAAYDTKLNQLKQEQRELHKKNSEKSEKCIKLVKEIEQLRARDDKYDKENKRLHLELASMTHKRDDSRKQLKVCEDERQKLIEQRDADRKTYDCKQRELEREISKFKDLVQQLEATLEERDTTIVALDKDKTILRAKLKDSEERIKQVEDELKENENIKQAIYSLMNKNKKG